MPTPSATSRRSIRRGIHAAATAALLATVATSAGCFVWIVERPAAGISIPGPVSTDAGETAAQMLVGSHPAASGIAATSQGNLQQSGLPFHVAIQGRGYFQLEDVTQTLYTRRGTFSLNADGELVLKSAGRTYRTLPNIVIPSDYLAVTIAANGIVSVIQPGQPEANTVGQIETAAFINPEGLTPLGDHLYAQTSDSGAAVVGSPGLEGRGTLQQGYFEMLPRVSDYDDPYLPDDSWPKYAPASGCRIAYPIDQNRE